jgi:phosphoglycerate dehydrogenase-like enzyme
MSDRVIMVGTRATEHVFGVVEAGLRTRPVEVERYRSVEDFMATPDALAAADLLFADSSLACSRALMAGGPQLRAVISPWIGIDRLDLKGASELGILVGNGRVAENYLSMAEATIMLMLASLYNLHEKEDAFRRNLPRPQRQTARMLRGKTIGMIGFGHMARAIAARLAAWEVAMQAYAPRLHEPFPSEVKRVELDELMRTSDIVSIHAALNEETRGMLDARRLALMKPDATLINTARGGIVDEAALARLAQEGRLKIALDVYETLPPPPDSPLRALPNAILTPHLVGHTAETHAAVPKAAIENILRVLDGKPPLSVCNPEILPAWTRRWGRERRGG